MYLYSWDTTGGGKKKVGPGVYYEGTARRGYFNCPKPLVKAIYRIVGVISAAQDMGCQIGAAGGGLAPPYLEEGWEKGLSVPPVMRIYGSLHEIRTDDPNPGLRLCPMPRPWLKLGIRVWRATSSLDPRPWNIVTQPLCLSHVQPRSLFLHLTLFLRVY